MIQINDTFRLQHIKASHWGFTLWHLEEWTATDRIEGRWQRVTNRMRTDSMDGLLERMQCPVKAHDEFKAIG